MHDLRSKDKRYRGNISRHGTKSAKVLSATTFSRGSGSSNTSWFSHKTWSRPPIVQLPPGHAFLTRSMFISGNNVCNEHHFIGAALGTTLRRRRRRPCPRERTCSPDNMHTFGDISQIISFGNIPSFDSNYTGGGCNRFFPAAQEKYPTTSNVLRE